MRQQRIPAPPPTAKRYTIRSREPAAVASFRRFDMREYNYRIAEDTAKAMKALYSTHKYIRMFIFGVPESWQVALYDI